MEKNIVLTWKIY